MSSVSYQNIIAYLINSLQYFIELRLPLSYSLTSTFCTSSLGHRVHFLPKCLIISVLFAMKITSYCVKTPSFFNHISFNVSIFLFLFLTSTRHVNSLAIDARFNTIQLFRPITFITCLLRHGKL